jgi:hypothetical protein
VQRLNGFPGCVRVEDRPGAWGCGDAVERDKGGIDDLAHYGAPPVSFVSYVRKTNGAGRNRTRLDEIPRRSKRR